MRIHDLRHSCATLLLAKGVNPRVVMDALGHSQVSLTLNTYSHVLPSLQRDAAARILTATLERKCVKRPLGRLKLIRSSENQRNSR